MITQAQEPVGWAHLITELDDAREHLESLLKEMVETGHITDEVFAVQLGHIYAHLNRAWNSRNQTTEISDEQWIPYSAFPTDLQVVG